MKKFSSLFSAMFLVAMLAIIVSCSKDFGQKDSPVAKYASAISGQFIPNDGDVTLKAAPLVGGHQINCYDKKTTGSDWSVVNGTEFLPGSLPAIDWTGYAIDGSSWWFPGNNVYITYCPVLPMKVVLKATEGVFGSTPSYLGIWEGTPNAASFPITVFDKRLGDLLTLNTTALTSLPGYSNMSFEVSYTKSVIDVNATGLASAPTSATVWPVYVYSSNDLYTVTKTKAESQASTTIYDGLDYKITGTITIKIHVDNTTLTVSTPATPIGKGLAITLSTTKVGWYNSGTIGVTESDITVDTVTLPVESL